MKSVATLRRGATLGLVLLLCMGGASAQVFKWVDANGKTHFSDRPPPPTAKPAQMKGSNLGSTSTASFPYALATAVRNYPVTLYTTSSCAGCDQGRSLLKARGIPFTEKTVSTTDDENRMKQAGGTGLPFLMVGGAKTTGFQSATWTSMLNTALYPDTNMLPSTYQYPAPNSAAPPVLAAEPDPQIAEAAAAAAAEEKRRKEAAKKPPTAPPGFQF